MTGTELQKGEYFDMNVKLHKGPLVGMRHVQALLIFLNIVSIYIGRLNVGISVVAITDAGSTNPNFPQYDWTGPQKSYIISSFYWGYVFTQFLGAYLCKRFGAKSVMFWGTLSSGVFSALTPYLISFGGWQAYCGIRVLMGCVQGVLFPCIYQHLARWSPPEERNRLGALSQTGIECGNVCAMFISGMIAKGPLGWPGISYVSAGIAFIWCALWFIFAANNATESRFIGTAERQYIESSLKHDENFHKTIIPIPWLAIWTSMPFWALMVAFCTEYWGFTTLQAEIPMYMNGVLDMDMKSNALFSALPFLAMWIMAYVYLITADILLSGKWLTLTALRKTFNSLAFWIPSCTLIGIGFLDVEQKTLAIVLMTISVGVNSGNTIGHLLNTIDLSPNHASIVMGIVNTAANVVSIVAPLLVGVIVVDNNDRSQWQIVFIIAAVIFFVGNCFYLIFGRTDCQPWDAPDYLIPAQPELALSKHKSGDDFKYFS